MSTSSTIGIRLALEGADKTEAGLRRVAGSMGSLESAATSVRSAVGGLAGVLAGSISVAGFVKAADAVTTLKNQLKLATGSAQTAAKAYEQLFEVAQRSRVSFTQLGSTFASITRASETMGLSQRELLSLTETIGNAITISGSSAQASQAALVQLQQGLASGVLRGEELNSVMEQTPRLARAIADGLNVPIGKLREMGQAGQLTAEQVINALRSQSAVLAGEVQNSVLTVSQAYTQLENSVVKAVGELDEATGTSKTLAQAISGLAVTVKEAGKAFSENKDVILTTVGVLGGAAAAAGILKLAGSIGAITVAFKALGVAMAANPAGLALLGIGAAAGGFVAYNESLKGTREGLAAAIRDLEDTNKSVENSIYGKPSASAMRQVEERKRQIREMRQALAAMDSAGLDTRAEDSRLARQNQTIRQASATATATPAKAKATAGGSRASDIGDNERALASYVSSLQKTIDKENELTEVQKAQAFLRSIGVVGQVDQVRELVMSLAEQRDAQIALEKSTERLAELERIAADAENARVDALERSAQSVQDQVQKLLDEEKALGIAAAGNISLAQAIEQVNIARLQEEQARLMQAGDRDAEVLAIQKEIEARRELASAIGRQDVREAAKKQAEDAKREWEKTADSIGDALTNALMRGFEDGKSFGDNFADSLVNAFKTYVARELQQSLARAISGAFSGQGGGFNLGSLFGGGGQGGFNWGDLISKGWNYFTGGNVAASGAITNGMTQAQMIAVQDAAVGVTTNVATGAVTEAAVAGTTTTGATTAGAGALGAVPVVGWIAAAVMAADALYKKGYNRDALKGVGESKDYKYSAENAARGLLDGLGFSKKWADILSGTVRMATLFGRRLKQDGYEVDISGQNVDVERYAFYKGGLLRSNKTVRGEADPESVESLRFQVENVRESSKAMAQALGYSGDALDNFTGRMRVNLKGADDSAEAAKRYEDALLELQRQMINSVTGLNYTKEQFKKFTEEVTASMTEAGISAGGIADIITQGMLGKMSQAQVGEALSDMVIGGIYNAIASNYAGQIASVFTGQIIQPIFTAIAAGVPISQAISQQAIANVVQTAKEAAAQLNAIFSDPGFRSAIAGVQEAISGISGAATSVRAPAYKAAASNYNAAADAAKRAAEETRRAWQSIADSITEEIRRIRGELLGDTTAGQSYYMAQFEDATRRARAGDQQAANRLPELSQAVLDIARATAGSLGELQFIQTSTIASLNQTSKIISQRFGLTIPAFADGGLHSGGLRLVGERGPELEVTGPARYFDARQTQKLMAGDPELTAKLDELIKATQRQADGISQIETNTRRTQQILDTVSQGGDSFVTVAA